MSTSTKLCPRCKIRPQARKRSYCRECEVQRVQEWLTADPVRGAAYHAVKNNNTRAKQLGAVGSVRLREWMQLVEQYGNACACCGQVTHLTIDHVKPISKGGTNTIANVQPLCIRCNVLKASREIDFRTKK